MATDNELKMKTSNLHLSNTPLEMYHTINEINRINFTNSDFEIGWMLKNNTTCTETILFLLHLNLTSNNYVLADTSINDTDIW
jgi:hypothetical protein